MSPGTAEQTRRAVRVVGPNDAPDCNYPARRCERCGRATRERKPWCADHILDSAYARRLSDPWDRRMAAKALAGIKLRHPEADARELELRSACLRLGRETVERALGRRLPFDDGA